MKLKTKDKIEIAQLCARYFLAVDTNNLQAYLSTWLENGVMEANNRTTKGHSQLKERFISMREGMSKEKKHFVTNIIIEGDRKKVLVTSYVLVVAQESKLQVIETGVYTDKIIKMEGKWYFEKRHLNLDCDLQPSQKTVNA